MTTQEVKKATTVNLEKVKAARKKNKAKRVMKKDGMDLNQSMLILKEQIPEECVRLKDQMAKFKSSSRTEPQSFWRQ